MQDNRNALIAILLWALGGALLIWLLWDTPLSSGPIGIVLGLAYFGVLYWLLEAVDRHYRGD